MSLVIWHGTWVKSLRHSSLRILWILEWTEKFYFCFVEKLFLFTFHIVFHVSWACALSDCRCGTCVKIILPVEILRFVIVGQFEFKVWREVFNQTNIRKKMWEKVFVVVFFDIFDDESEIISGLMRKCKLRNQFVTNIR